MESDPRLDQLNECLPGANCGGCGYAGCGAYAEAVLKGEAPIGKCASGGNEAAQAMAAIMGVKAEAVTRKVALVRCSGEKIYDADGNLTKGAKIKGDYEGLKDCLAASKIGGNGPVSCKFGCLGYGTCVKACQIRRDEGRQRRCPCGRRPVRRLHGLCQRMPPSSDRPRGA